MLFEVGVSNSEKLKIEIIGYEREATGEYYDDNWLSVKVSLSFGGFQGVFSAAFLTRDFHSFLPQLEQLYKSLKGTIKFETLEQQLEFTLTGDGKGNIELSGEAMDEAGPANLLKFYSSFDQTYLPSSISQLTKLCGKYPERGAL
jgi:hypothetical protein